MLNFIGILQNKLVPGHVTTQTVNWNHTLAQIVRNVLEYKLLIARLS